MGWNTQGELPRMMAANGRGRSHDCKDQGAALAEAETDPRGRGSRKGAVSEPHTACPTHAFVHLLLWVMSVPVTRPAPMLFIVEHVLSLHPEL